MTTAALPPGSVFLTIVPSFRDFQRAVSREAKAADRAFGAEFSKTSPTTARDDEKRGRDQGGAYGRAMARAISEVLAALPAPSVQADTSPAEARLAAIRSQIEGLQTHKAHIGADTREAVALLARLEEQLKALALGETDADVIVNAGTAYAALKRVRHDQSRVDGRRATAHVGVRTTGSADAVNSRLRAFSGRTLITAALLPAVVPAAAAAGLAVGALGTSLLVGALGLGALVAGFSGIGPAVTALGDVRKNGAKDALARTKATRAAGTAVRDAQQALDRARQQAADSQTDAARKVADAQRQTALAAAEVRDAEHDLTRAQQALTDARTEGRRQLDGFALEARSADVSERQALVDVFEAQAAYNAAIADSGATNLDREQAAIRLEQARTSLEAATAERARLAAMQQEAGRTGVDGTDVVTRARDALATSTQRVTDAHRSAADAAQAVTDAQLEATRAGRDAAESTRDAAEHLADAQSAYAEAVQQTAQSPSQQTLADAMANMGPAGRAFSTFLAATVVPLLLAVRMRLQEGVLPGVQSFLATVIGTYAPQMTTFAASFGRVAGDLFSRFGALLTTPPWRAFFAALSSQAPQMLRTGGRAFLSMLTALAQLGTAFAPLAVRMLRRLADGSAHLADAAGKRGALSGFVDFATRSARALVDFGAAFAGAVLNLGRGLTRYAVVLLGVFGGLARFLASLSPRVLQGIALGLVAVVGAVQGLLGLRVLAQVVLAAIDAPELVIAGAVVALVLGLVALYQHSETFRAIVSAAMAAVGAVVGAVWDTVLHPILTAAAALFLFVGGVWLAVFSLLGGLFRAAARQLAAAWSSSHIWDALSAWAHTVGDAWTAGAAVISNVLDPVFSAIGRALTALADAINVGIVDPFNRLADVFGSKRLHRISLAFAVDRPATATASNAAQARKNRVAPQRLATGGYVGTDRQPLRSRITRALRRRLRPILTGGGSDSGAALDWTLPALSASSPVLALLGASPAVSRATAPAPGSTSTASDIGSMWARVGPIGQGGALLPLLASLLRAPSSYAAIPGSAVAHGVTSSGGGQPAPSLLPSAAGHRGLLPSLAAPLALQPRGDSPSYGVGAADLPGYAAGGAVSARSRALGRAAPVPASSVDVARASLSRPTFDVDPSWVDHLLPPELRLFGGGVSAGTDGITIVGEITYHGTAYTADDMCGEWLDGIRGRARGGVYAERI